MFLIRGIVFSREAVRDWEGKLTLALAEALRHRRRGKVGWSWYVDDTYFRVQGRWCYLYRAIDSSGALVDVRLSETHDMAAARAFFESADRLPHTTAPLIDPTLTSTAGHFRALVCYPKMAENEPRRLLHRLMNAQQQMRWSPRGAHLMLKVWTSVVNGTLDPDHTVAERWARWAVSSASGLTTPTFRTSL
jgi:transposase-like protein